MLAADRAATIRRYRARLLRNGFGPRALGWDKGRQDVRFAAALDRLGTGFSSILDVGCGLGDLYAFLRARGWRGRYLGLDVVPEFVAEARRRFGARGARFRELDISARPARLPQADVAVAIGLFNHRMRQASGDYLASMLDAMWRSSSRAVVLDFLSSTATRRRPSLRYWDAGRVMRLGLRRTRRAALAHDYIPFEFMLTLWHDDSFSRRRPAFRRRAAS